MERQRNIVTAGPGGTDTATQAEGAVFVDVEEHDSALVMLREVLPSYLSSDGLSGVTVYLEEFGQSGVEWCVCELLSVEKSSSFLCACSVSVLYQFLRSFRNLKRQSAQ